MGDTVIKKVEDWDPINRFEQRPGFPMSYVVVCFFCSVSLGEVIVRFVDIGGIVDQTFHNIPFTRTKHQSSQV